MHRYFFIFIIILVIGCTEEKITTRDYPRLETLGVSKTADGVVFKGNIFAQGNSAITDHGFTWSTSFPNIRDSPKISLGKRSTIGEFKGVVSAFNFEKGKTYTVRAFVVSGAFEVYGTDQTFSLK